MLTLLVVLLVLALLLGGFVEGLQMLLWVALVLFIVAVVLRLLRGTRL